MTLEEFIKEMKPRRTLMTHNSIDQCTDVIMNLKYDIDLSMAIDDGAKEDDNVIFSIHHNQELIVANSAPLSEILDCFQKAEERANEEIK